MIVQCQRRAASVHFNYEQFEFNPLEIEQFADRSSAETVFTLLIMKDGSRHLVDLYYLEVSAKIREALQ